MPDALSKTIPIWITVLNRWLFPDRPDVHELITPEDVVSRSEHSQIESRLPSCLENLHALGLDAAELRSRFNHKPLSPCWVTPDSGLPSAIAKRATTHLVVLCTASGRTASSALAPIEYVQGAADDSESWACGLDARIFWANRKLLLSTPEDDLPYVIKDLVDDANLEAQPNVPTKIKSTNISISSNASAESAFVDYHIVVSCSSKPSAVLTEKLGSRYIHLTCAEGKVGGRQIRDQLPRIYGLKDLVSPANKVLVTCDNGRDHSVGVALTIMCLENGMSDARAEHPRAVLSKALIKQRLSEITLSMPEAAPSRATLQSVNAFLLGQDVRPG